MAKEKTVYVCSNCGQDSPKWVGKCPSCGMWNTYVEEVVRKEVVNKRPVSGIETAKAKPITLHEIVADDEPRIDLHDAELNRVLGGGLVQGSLVLIGGEPGIGKSTILLQLCGEVSRTRSVLYVTGEESVRQIKLRAVRLDVPQDNISIVAESDVDEICGLIEQMKPDLVVIDSIQTMRCTDVASSSGTVSQVKESSARFLNVAKTNEIPTFIVGHVNKDGAIAGPKVMEHIVDTVLYFEGDKQLSYRILRAAKNRFGSTNEIGVFEMQDKGLEQVENPSAMLLLGRPAGVSGITVLCTVEGTRPILAEVQALVSKTSFSAPRRMTTGFDYSRLCVLLAVLEKRTGYNFGGYDVYINVIGGLKIDEPASDLAIALALYSGLRDIPIGDDVAMFGEVGLGGEIRAVSHIRERVREAARMGFSKCIVPKSSLKNLDKSENYGISIYGVANLQQAFKVLEMFTKESEGNKE